SQCAARGCRRIDGSRIGRAPLGPASDTRSGKVHARTSRASLRSCSSSRRAGTVRRSPGRPGPATPAAAAVPPPSVPDHESDGGVVDHGRGEHGCDSGPSRRRRYGYAVKALVYDATAAPPEVRDVPDPACPPDGVIIEVAATGVCRSDWHAWQGHEPVPLHQVGGHEFAGTVAAVGEQVRRWAVGDRVTAPFVNGCGRCEFCLTGDAQVCPDQTQPGFTGWGSFAELVAVRAADLNLVRLPDPLGFAE